MSGCASLAQASSAVATSSTLAKICSGLAKRAAFTMRAKSALPYFESAFQPWPLTKASSCVRTRYGDLKLESPYQCLE